MSAQALASLVIVGLVVARAVNILLNDEPRTGGPIPSASARAGDPRSRRRAARPRSRRAARHPMRALDARAMELASVGPGAEGGAVSVRRCRPRLPLAGRCRPAPERVPARAARRPAAARGGDADRRHTKAGRAALGAAAAAGVGTWRTGSSSARRPHAALGVLRGLWSRGVASSVDLLGEATVTEPEADAYAARCADGARASSPARRAAGPRARCSSATASERCRARTCRSRSRR